MNVPSRIPGLVDNMTVEQRRRTMQAVKGKNTSLERTMGSAMHRAGLRFRKHVGSLPGRPDFVFASARVVVFVDGDFWHGWRFPQWRDKLGEYWQAKIDRNRRRDALNFRRLRRSGWTVARFWEHQLKRDLAGAVRKVKKLVGAGLRKRGAPTRTKKGTGRPRPFRDSGSRRPQ